MGSWKLWFSPWQGLLLVEDAHIWSVTNTTISEAFLSKNQGSWMDRPQTPDRISSVLPCVYQEHQLHTTKHNHVWHLKTGRCSCICLIPCCSVLQMLRHQTGKGLDLSTRFTELLRELFPWRNPLGKHDYIRFEGTKHLQEPRGTPPSWGYNRGSDVFGSRQMDTTVQSYEGLHPGQIGE